MAATGRDEDERASAGPIKFNRAPTIPLREKQYATSKEWHHLAVRVTTCDEYFVNSYFFTEVFLIPRISG
jgi:hypothetical protein